MKLSNKLLPAITFYKDNSNINIQSQWKPENDEQGSQGGVNHSCKQRKHSHENIKTHFGLISEKRGKIELYVLFIVIYRSNMQV